MPSPPAGLWVGCAPTGAAVSSAGHDHHLPGRLRDRPAPQGPAALPGPGAGPPHPGQHRRPAVRRDHVGGPGPPRAPGLRRRAPRPRGRGLPAGRPAGHRPGRRGRAQGAAGPGGHRRRLRGRPGPRAAGLVRLAGTCRPGHLPDGGVIPEDLPFSPEGLVGASFHPTTFVLPPLPNQMFMRDTSAWMYGGVSINPMAFPARHRETMHLETVYRRHPMFAAVDFPVWYGGDGLDHYPAVVEGGDLLVIGHRALLVGMGGRTTPQGVEALARRLFDAGVLDTLVAVELPKVRAYMHLDTVLTQVDH